MNVSPLLYRFMRQYQEKQEIQETACQRQCCKDQAEHRPAQGIGCHRQCKAGGQKDPADDLLGTQRFCQKNNEQNFQQNYEHICIKPTREASLDKGGSAGNKDSSGNAAGCRFADPARGRKSSKAGECSHHYDQPEFDAVQFCSEPSVQDPEQTGCQPDDPGLVFSCTSFRIKAHRIPGFPFRADAVSESPVFQIVICDPYMIIGIVFIQIQLTGVHGPGFSRCVGNSRQAHSWQPYQYGCQHDKDRTNYFIQWNADLFLHNLYTTQLRRLR